MALVVKDSSASAGNIRDAGQEDSLEESMATDSSILAWGTPWKEPGGLQTHKESGVTLHTC